MATITLTNSADYYDATYAYTNDTIYALKGEDFIYSGSGRDTIYGGDGDDDLYGNDGDDTIGGGTGHDFLYGGNGFDRLNGDAGNDSIVDYDATGIYNGGDGNDDIHVHGGYVTAGAGRDVVTLHSLSAGVNTVFLGTGADTVYLETDNQANPGVVRVNFRDFKAEDRLVLDGFDQYGNYLSMGTILDGLDRNNDRWLGRKDVEQFDDGDGYEVVVGKNTLELHIGDDAFVFSGMINASFDFLS